MLASQLSTHWVTPGCPVPHNCFYPLLYRCYTDVNPCFTRCWWPLCAVNFMPGELGLMCLYWLSFESIFSLFLFSLSQSVNFDLRQIDTNSQLPSMTICITNASLFSSAYVYFYLIWENVSGYLKFTCPGCNLKGYALYLLKRFWVKVILQLVLFLCGHLINAPFH